MDNYQETGLTHHSTTWAIEPDVFGEKFNDDSAMLQLTATKNGHHFTAITEINRDDLINLRQTIDEYLSK